jgi:fructosamine-3-kinase
VAVQDGQVNSFVKTRPDAPEGFFEAEAAGLRWLAAAGGARVARVERVEPGRIVVEGIREVAPTASAARAFGVALAETHAAGATAFGAPPEGWSGPCFIGKRALATRPERSWGRFYAEQRVVPYARIALEVGSVTESEHRRILQVCEAISVGEFDDGEPPARLHGDLWTGNVLFGGDGVVLIDPAAHGGHRETDLAMLALFGCPYLDDVIDGYDETAPLVTGWRERIPLHQLHPLAVHAASYGRGYGKALVHAANSSMAMRY